MHYLLNFAEIQKIVTGYKATSNILLLIDLRTA